MNKVGDRGRTDSPTPPERSFSPWSDDFSSDSGSDAAASEHLPDTPLSKATRNVDLMLDQLARIAVIIRRAGSRSRLEKADRTLTFDDHQDLRDHLTVIVLSQGPFSPESIFSPEHINHTKLNEIQSRLINCNLKRRNRFLYAQRHSQRLDTTSLTQLHPQKAAEKEATSSQEPTPKARQQQEPEELRVSVQNPTPFTKPERRLLIESVKTGTSASGVTDLLPLPQNPVPSQAASTHLSTTAINLDYPYPPNMTDNALLFRCPCCCQALPVMFSLKNRWR